jgi:hypothetical protein
MPKKQSSGPKVIAGVYALAACATRAESRAGDRGGGGGGVEGGGTNGGVDVDVDVGVGVGVDAAAVVDVVEGGVGPDVIGGGAGATVTRWIAIALCRPRVPGNLTSSFPWPAPRVTWKW